VHLTEVLAQWNPERRGELARRMAALSRDIVPDAPRQAV
jgi:hypothetical protein